MYVRCTGVNVERVKFDTCKIAVYLCNAGSSESYYDSHNIDSELELKKFGNAVVDISSPHNSLHDAAEVVISEDNV